MEAQSRPDLDFERFGMDLGTFSDGILQVFLWFITGFEIDLLKILRRSTRKYHDEHEAAGKAQKTNAHPIPLLKQVFELFRNLMLDPAPVFADLGIALLIPEVW